MFIVEFVLSTLLFEKIRSWWPTKQIQNDVKAIREIEQLMPTFRNVGELRALLSHFSDDVPVNGSSFEFSHIQVREVNGQGLIVIGSSSHETQYNPGNQDD